MRWTVKIEGKPELQIEVQYIPLYDKLEFKGFYHKARTNSWLEFHSISVSSDIDVEGIQKMLFDVYERLAERVKQYENLNEGFKYISLIEIPED
jgi:hypothetical protein